MQNELPCSFHAILLFTFGAGVGCGSHAVAVTELHDAAANIGEAASESGDAQSGDGSTAPHMEAGSDAPSDSNVDGTDPDAGVDAPDPDGGSRCATAWQRDQQWGTAFDDEALAVAVDDEARVWVAGYERGDMTSSNVPPAGDAVGFVRQFGRDGSGLFRRDFDTPGADTVDALVRYRDGWAFAGRTTGAFPDSANAGQFDMFVGTMNAAGNVTRFVQLGNERPEHPHRILPGADGQLLVAGYDDIYVPTNYVESWEDPFLARVTEDPSATGGLRVDLLRKFGTETGDLAYDLAPVGSSSGHVLLSGQVNGGAKPGSYLWRLDAAGEIRWALRLSAGGLESAAAVVPIPGGDVFLVGSTIRQIGGIGFGNADVFVARIGVEGPEPIVRWVRQAGSEGGELVRGAVLAPDGVLYVAGETSGAVAPGAKPGINDPFVLGFSSDGRVRGAWQRDTSREGTPSYELVNGIAIDPCGGFFIVGATEGTVSSGMRSGRWDAYLVHAELAPVP